MATFRVWAPHAKQLALCLGRGRGAQRGWASRVPMAAEREGWWRAEVPEAGPGTDYAFALEDGQPLPDPRSPWQPEGVHGPSRLLDHAGFRWTTARWASTPVSAALIYELHVGTFTPAGTFDGAIDRLAHLVDLGVTHVEFMPVNEFSGTRGWGYDGVDLFAPHHAYGGPDGLKRLVDACHAHGLLVLLDVVYNHLGPEGNYLERFGPYFTGRYSTPWGRAVNFDGRGSHEVRRFFCDNARMWLRDYRVDGLRIDAVHAIMDVSARHFLEQLAEEVVALEAEVGRPLVLIAESDLNDPRVVRPREIGGHGLEAQWNEDFHHAVHALLTGERRGYYGDFGALGDLAHVLQRGFLYDGRFSRYRGRPHGRPATGLSGHRFIGCLQNHDQVGNRARGDRTSHLLSPGRLRIGAALVLTAPFVPLIFQGEEWGASTPFQYFTAHDDPTLGAAVRDGRRREFAAFGWKHDDIPDPQAPETFQRSKLDWDELGREPHRSLLDWHRRLVRLRRSQAGFTDGRMDALRIAVDEAARWLVMERGTVAVAVNLADRAQVVPLTAAPRGLLLASEPDIRVTEAGVALPPDAVAVLDLGPEATRRPEEGA